MTKDTQRTNVAVLCSWNPDQTQTEREEVKKEEQKEMFML